MQRARGRLPIVGKAHGRDIRCPTGDAVVTVPGNLSCDCVIHAVGPDMKREEYKGRRGFDLALKRMDDTYRNVMKRAEENDVKVIAFCIICGGSFRGKVMTRAQVIGQALQLIAKWAYETLEHVFFCAYTSLTTPGALLLVVLL